MNKELLRATLMGEDKKEGRKWPLGSYAKKGEWPKDLSFYDEAENLYVFFSRDGDVEIRDKQQIKATVSGRSIPVED